MPAWTSCFGGGGLGMSLGAGFMTLSWIAIAIGVLLLFNWFSRQSYGAAGKTALQILQERYARGEIQHDEYEQKKRELIA